MTREEFKSQFGMEPERAKEILEELRHIVNREVHEVIAHADFYIDPEAYGYDEELTKEDEDDDGYTCLYDYGNQSGGAVKAADAGEPIAWMPLPEPLTEPYREDKG